MIKSELKTVPEGFNNCPSRTEISEFLQRNGLTLSYVDMEKDYWQNADDTIVVKISKEDMGTALRIGKFATEMRPDEFNIINTWDGEFAVVRMWWD